jgi:hypothetical protein
LLHTYLFEKTRRSTHPDLGSMASTCSCQKSQISHVTEKSSTRSIDIVARACTESHYFLITARSLAPEITECWIRVHLEAAIACTRNPAIHTRWLDTLFPRCQ